MITVIHYYLIIKLLSGCYSKSMAANISETTVVGITAIITIINIKPIII